MDNDANYIKRFGKTFQSKCIGVLLSDRAFLERIVDILSPDYFETDAHRWIIKLIMEYFPKYKGTPTRDVFKVEISKITDPVMNAAVLEQYKAAYMEMSTPDATYIKEQFLEFCKNQKLKSAIYEAGDLLKVADYDGIWRLIKDATEAGVERDLGHDYFNEFDERMSEAAREVVKTNWEIIDGHLDGGLGKGELGFIVAPAGSGKCVGPNTEIEIKYEEIGIPVIGNSGKEYVIWLSPLGKYNIGNETLYGWQIDDIFFKIEKLKLFSVEQENIHKK